MLRYPTVSSLGQPSILFHSSKRSELAQVKALLDKGPTEWVRSMTYFRLLNAYFELLLPASTELTAILPQGSELFLALAIDFWLDMSRVVRRNFQQVESIRAKQLGSPSQAAKSAGAHPGPLETVFVDSGDVGHWSMLTLQCIYFMVHRMVKTASLAGDMETLQAAYLKQKSIDGRSSSAGIKSSQTAAVYYLPHAFLLFQVSFYENLKLMFSKGHVLETSKFYLIVESWLLYIQPWKSNKEPKYTPKWRAYIVANFHFYTTLFTLYLRSTARMDLATSRSLTSNEFILLDLLERVLGVFDEEVVDLLEEIHCSVFQKLRSQVEIASTPLKNALGKGDQQGLTLAELEVAVAHHFDIHPDSSIASLADAGLVFYRYHSRDACKVIVESVFTLTEPMQKDFMTALYEYMFGAEGPDLPTRKAQSVIRCLTEVLGIVDPVVLVNRRKFSKLSSSESADVDRTSPDNKLTDVGRRQIMSGERKCSKSFVHYRGDQMDRPLHCQEWRHLARLLIQASKALNHRWQLPKDSSSASLSWKDVYFICRRNIWTAHKVLGNCFRINLRVLADVRVALVLVLYFLRLVHKWRAISSLTFFFAGCLFATLSYLQYNSYFVVG